MEKGIVIHKPREGFTNNNPSEPTTITGRNVGSDRSVKKKLTGVVSSVKDEPSHEATLTHKGNSIF